MRADVASHDPPVALEAVCPPQYPVPLSLDDALPVGEWKVVTILCCALVAPAMQGEQRCLETWQRRLHTLHELARHEAQRYGGMFRPIGGEGVLMVFGAPVAQEDHAQRAVLTALSLQRQLAGRQGARASLGAEALQVRMGLHTGRATVGVSAASHERSAVVVGETVTRAMALQQHARSGTILCSEATARLVQRVVRLKAMPLVSVDGQATRGENLSGTGTAYATCARRAAPGACQDTLCRPGAGVGHAARRLGARDQGTGTGGECGG